MQEPSDQPSQMLSDVLEEPGAGRQEARPLHLVYCVSRDQPVVFPQRYSQEVKVAGTCNGYQLLSTYYVLCWFLFTTTWGQSQSLFTDEQTEATEVKITQLKMREI